MKSKVFVASTSRDLVVHRQTVVDYLRKFRKQPVSMEVFAPRGLSDTQTSLEELSECNVFVGIIGRVFGTISDDGFHSVTQREYLRAKELQRETGMRLLIFLSKDNTPLPSEREPDELYKRQEEFRAQLAEDGPQQFDDPNSLVGKLAEGITWAMENRKIQPLLTIFGAKDFEKIREKFDSVSRERFRRVEKFLTGLSQLFRCLFHLDSSQLYVHPLFANAKNLLHQLIPGVSLDDKEGVLMRADVRHVIFRTEAIVQLISRIENENHLVSVGEEIGASAARVLVNTMRTQRLVPDSAEALIILWDYWARTGGWGKLTLLPEANEREGRASVETGGGIQKTDAQPWRIKIEENFLSTGSLDRTHALCAFWCGYIKGMLNGILPEMDRIIAEHVDTDEQSQIALPAYRCVREVVHETEGDTADKVDVFLVQFQVTPLSSARSALNRARRYLHGRDLPGAVMAIHQAVESTRKELGEGEFNRRYTELSSTKPQADSSISVFLRRYEDDESVRLGQVQEDLVRRWFEDVYLLIQKLSRANETDCLLRDEG